MNLFYVDGYSNIRSESPADIKLLLGPALPLTHFFSLGGLYSPVEKAVERWIIEFMNKLQAMGLNRLAVEWCHPV